MSTTTVYAAEIIDTMAERWNLDQFTGTPICIHGVVDDELVGWLGGPLPTNGYPCEHMGMGDNGNTACWSATEINRLRDDNKRLQEENERLRSCLRDDAENERLRDENAKLRDLCKRFAEYVSQDRCEGCVLKSRCNDGEIEECWQRTEIRNEAHKLGIGVDG